MLVRAVALVLMIWVGASLAKAQTPGSAAPATTSETDRLTALEKELRGAGSSDCRGAVGGG